MLGVADTKSKFCPQNPRLQAMLHQETSRLQHERRCFVDHQNQDKQGVVKPLISIPHQLKPNEAGAIFFAVRNFVLLILTEPLD